MTYKFTNRKKLQTSEWLALTAASSWHGLQPPSRDDLKLQQFDLSSHLNTALAGQHIKDAFERLTEAAGEAPTRDDRVASDGPMAVAIHKALDGLTLREASDPDFWAYLTCFGCPQYVRWRYDTPKAGALWARFAGNKTRNALARLWWWAEITYDSSRSANDAGRYAATRIVGGRTSLMLFFVDCAFSGHPLVARQLIAVQEQQALSDAAQKALCKTVNRLARVVCLDCVGSSEEAEALCDRALAISRLLNA